jgi:hypothetical protein
VIPILPLAHLMNTGLGPFYDGLAHFFTTPEDLLPVLALSILAGLRGAPGGRAALFVLPPAWILGGAVGRAFTPHWIWPVASAALTVLVGALAAADRPISARWIGGLAAVLGLWHGAWNGIELARAGAAALGNLIGVATAAFVVVAIVAAFTSTVRVAWGRIAVRVGGSWIAAAGLFMLGWSLR